MRRFRSTFAESALALGTLAALIAGEGSARAQACCVAVGASGAARLGPHEAALAGVEGRAQAGYGSFDAGGGFRAAPAGTRELGLEQRVFGTVRFLSRGQASVLVPFVETSRAASGISESGGGIGDVRLSVRWDLVYPEHAKPLPGLALLAGVALPTGVPPEKAGGTLGASATGVGTTQIFGGFALEQTAGPWLYGASATLTGRVDREVGGVSSSLAPRFAAGPYGAYVWQSGAAVSLAALYAVEGRATVNGAVVAGSAQRGLELTLALQVALADIARLVVSAYGLPPIATVSAGEPAYAGGALGVIVPWM